MNYVKMAAWFSIAGLTLGVPLSGLAEDHQQKKPTQQWVQEKIEKPEMAVRIVQAQTKKPATAADMPVYKPPKLGAPGGRVGGGTRSIQREVFVLTVLAPDHTGLTVNEQPSLYWFISSPTSSPVELTVIDPRATKPVLETRMPSPVQPGVHRIRLADHGVRLSPGVSYRWFVAVVPDPDRRSRDILSGGAIERVDLPEGLRAKLAQAAKAELPFLYAEAGLWYDALMSISELIETAPSESTLRKQRASFLAQVGLPEISQ